MTIFELHITKWPSIQILNNTQYKIVEQTTSKGTKIHSQKFLGESIDEKYSFSICSILDLKLNDYSYSPVTNTQGITTFYAFAIRLAISKQLVSGGLTSTKIQPN